MTAGSSVSGRVLHAGVTSAPVVRLDAPLSFWGGFDAASGSIIDQAHPQVGMHLTGRVVVMPGSRGSSGTPGVLAESIRRGTGPAAIVVQKADINMTAGAVVAATLYGLRCPIVLLGNADFDEVASWHDVAVSNDGTVQQVS